MELFKNTLLPTCFSWGGHTFTSWWFQPIWKILVQIGSFPQIGMKIKNLWNHHLANCFSWGPHFTFIFGRQGTTVGIFSQRSTQLIEGIEEDLSTSFLFLPQEGLFRLKGKRRKTIGFHRAKRHFSLHFPWKSTKYHKKTNQITWKSTTKCR